MMGLSIGAKESACAQRKIPGRETEWTRVSVKSQAICSNCVSGSHCYYCSSLNIWLEQVRAGRAKFNRKILQG